MKSKIRLFAAILLAFVVLPRFMADITKPITVTENHKTVEFTPNRFLDPLFLLTFH